MQDKLLKILEFKIGAINKNIDNLNYLNGELNRNNEDLKYVENILDLFKDDDILNFDNILQEDFSKLLSMIDPSVLEIFEDKACNYQGIMYIIQGIRQGISLELTAKQKNAILALIEGMKVKIEDLKDVIENLNESLERLPETNLEILNINLKKYQDIIEKFQEGFYITEVDDLVEAIDFSNVLIEEKVALFEFILKYNADIYSKNQQSNIVKEPVEDLLKEINLPEFHYEPINVELEKENTKEETNYEEALNNEKEEIIDNQEDINNFDDLKTFQIPIIQNEDFEIPVYEPTQEDLPTLNNNLDTENLESNDSENTANILDLEDIIQKIDAKLKEMETIDENENELNLSDTLSPLPETEISNSEILENVDFENKNLENENFENRNLENENLENQNRLKEVLLKYDLQNLEITKPVDALEIDNMLKTLTDNKILDLLKENTRLLLQILENNTNDYLNQVLTLIKDNLAVNPETYQNNLEIIIATMPTLLINPKTIEAFKANIEFFKEHQINLINLFDNYRELLIMDDTCLKNNYLKIEKYGLALNNDNVKYLLYNKNLLQNLDYYIEAMGHEKGFLGKEDVFDGIEYITKHPYKLNNIDKKVLMKLRYSTDTNQKIYGSKPGILAGEIANPKVDILVLPDDYTNSYFNGEYNFMDRKDMLDLMEDIKKDTSFDLSCDDIIDKLDNQYKQSDLRYKIGDVLISRVKTIRLYNYLKQKGLETKKSLLIALTYNSVIKNVEYQNIENVVNNLVGGN